MNLPFDSASFFNLFGSYNAAVWPLQILSYLLGFYLIFLFVKNPQKAEGPAFYILSFFWLVNGIAYHLIHFSAINKAAFAFGALFVLQALLYLWQATKSPAGEINLTPVQRIASWSLLIYAVLIYPVIGYFTGHRYPNAPVFGVVPCPTTIFTFGVLLQFPHRMPWYLYLIPLIWAVIGTSAAFVLGVREDFGLAVAGMVFMAFLIARRLFPPATDVE